MREVGTDGISTEWVAQSKDKQLERKEGQRSNYYMLLHNHSYNY